MTDRPNEQWWAQHGHYWLQEIERRKEWQIFYLLQEAFLSAYFSQLPPVKVLDFGCGFGRHMRYLREVPGVDVHGVDQSQSMLDAMGDWADDPWRKEHTTFIAPRGRLPFEDKSFDIVFTVSVLIHVQPEDVPTVLSELARVCRGHILHLENAPVDASKLRCKDHNGCWGHPLEKLYAEMGIEAEVLPAIGSIQGVYRAIVGKTPPPPYVHNLAQRLQAIHQMTDKMLVNVKRIIDYRDQMLQGLGAKPPTDPTLNVK